MKEAGRLLARVPTALLVVGIALILPDRHLAHSAVQLPAVSGAQPNSDKYLRGKYLAENVSGCMECHTPHDWAARKSPLTPGMIGAGELVPLEGMHGRIVAPNITPDPETGAGNWTDDQLARAIREGIGHDGRALFPTMPYLRYRKLSDDDLEAIIVYLRSLPPVRKSLPKTRINFLVSDVVGRMPARVTAPVPRPDVSTPEQRGAYLVEIAACADCHTPMDSLGHRLKKLEFGGGFVLTGPFGSVASANLTPDPSGIPYYDEQMFIGAIRNGLIGARKLNPVMPWTSYSGMTDEDLVSMSAYLRHLPPVHHRVDNLEPPTYCRICKKRHGLGSLN
jgi:mono/diheme cytochrome c family protein